MARPGIDFPGVGVGLLIARYDGHVLLYRRVLAPEAGHWSIVGGKVDHLEKTEDAARREAEEETGLTIGQIRLLGHVEAMIDRQHWLSLIYATGDFTGEPRLTEPEKLSAMGWFDPADPPEPLSYFARQAFAMLVATPLAPSRAAMSSTVQAR